MNIISSGEYPSNELSNFAKHEFIIDNVNCYSMESFLQSLKCNDINEQKYVCERCTQTARALCKEKKWWMEQKLYWQGIAIDRHSQEYQDLLDRAYAELAKNTSFRKALLASGNAVLTHSMGKTDESKTVLTTREFCSRLTRIREKMKQEKTLF